MSEGLKNSAAHSPETTSLSAITRTPVLPALRDHGGKEQGDPGKEEAQRKGLMN